MKYIAILPFLAYSLIFTAPYAMADSYSRTPAGAGTYASVAVDVTIDDLSACVDSWFITAVSFNPTFVEISSDPVSVAQNSATFYLTSNPNFEVVQITAGCDGITGSLVSLEYDGGAPIFYLENNSIWPSGSLFGNTTPLQLTASVADGVRDTGMNIWPLFALVGVALAFVIAGFIVNFIQKSVDSRKKERKKMDLFIEREIEKSKAHSWREQDEISARYDEQIKKL
jgi:hypothetical protein